MAHHIRISGKLNRSHGGNFAIFAMLVIIGLFMGLPLYYSIISAFKPPSELFLFPPRFYVSEPTGRNFTQLFQLATNLTVPFIRYLFNSVFVSLVSTALGVVIGAAAAYPFAKKEFPGKTMLWRLIMMTLLFSGGVTSLPSYIVKAKLGLINTYWVLILPSLASTLHMFLMRQFMLQIPDSLLEAARIDGAGMFRTFFRVVFPLLTPVTATVAALHVMWIWNDFNVALIMLQKDAVRTLTVKQFYFFTQYSSDYNMAFAASLMGMLPVMIFFLVMQKYLINGITDGAVKG